MRAALIAFTLAAAMTVNAAELTGTATWYSRASSQREGTGGQAVLRADGQPLDDNAMTCALWIVGRNGRPLRPDGRWVIVHYGQRSIKAQWCDNGPGRGPRAKGVVIDLTPAAMRRLAGERGIRMGRVPVRVEW